MQWWRACSGWGRGWRPSVGDPTESSWKKKKQQANWLTSTTSTMSDVWWGLSWSWVFGAGEVLLFWFSVRVWSWLHLSPLIPSLGLSAVSLFYFDSLLSNSNLWFCFLWSGLVSAVGCSLCCPLWAPSWCVTFCQPVTQLRSSFVALPFPAHKAVVKLVCYDFFCGIHTSAAAMLMLLSRVRLWSKAVSYCCITTCAFTFVQYCSVCVRMWTRFYKTSQM